MTIQGENKFNRSYAESIMEEGMGTIHSAEVKRNKMRKISEIFYLDLTGPQPWIKKQLRQNHGRALAYGRSANSEYYTRMSMWRGPVVYQVTNSRMVVRSPKYFWRSHCGFLN